MRKKERFIRLFSGMMAVAMAGGGLIVPGTAHTVQAAASSAVIDNFVHPTSTQKPMARMWFPDAAAGEDEQDTIALQINQLAEAGFGGIEVAYLADGSLHSNADAAKYGWGTENWNKTLKKILRAANAVEGGFMVDLTFTPHWPLCINTIDPNDDAASKIETHSFTKVTGTSQALELPADPRTQDNAGNPFIFTDDLVSAAVVQVKSAADGKYELDYDTMQDITSDVSPTEPGGHAAGIPDETYFNEHKAENGWDKDKNGKARDYASAVIEVFGEEPESFIKDAADNVSEKIDKDFRRARLADYQYAYTATVDAGQVSTDKSDAVKAGDWIIVASYQRGSGQIFSDGAFGGTSESMVNNLYTPNYLDQSGIDVITDYWEKYILSDAELKSLMEKNAEIAGKNGGTPMLFEDSLELVGESNLWKKTMPEAVKKYLGADYPYADVFGALYAIENSEDYSTSVSVSGDYAALKDALLAKEHYGAVSAWAKEKCAGYGFRVQHDTDILAQDQENVDIIEGDNGSKGDGLRRRSSFKNLYHKGILSMEAVTGMETYSLSWPDVLIEVSQNYSQGVNHVILHGTSYNKSCNGYNAQWPGWSGFGSGFADDYNARVPYWEEAQNLTGYMARTQAVLQTGVQKVDVAVFESSNTAAAEAIQETDGIQPQTDDTAQAPGEGGPGGGGFPGMAAKENEQQILLDNGYSYDILTDVMLSNAARTDVETVGGTKVIYKDGPAYKAVILDAATLENMENKAAILDYAAKGLKVYVIGSGSLPNVTYVADRKEALLAQMKKDGITASASYEAPDLTTTHYEEGNADYYYLYNDNDTNKNDNMLNAGIGNTLKAGKDIYTTVTLEGEGTPYIFDAMTGEITPAAAYEIDEAGKAITMDVELEARESLIIGIIPDSVKNADLPARTDIRAVNTGSGSAYRIEAENGRTVLKAEKAGNYEAVYADSTTQKITVAKVREPQDISSGWNLTIESFGPDYSDANVQGKVTSLTDGKERTIYKNPSQTFKTALQFSGLDLAADTSVWKNLTAPAVLNSEGYSAKKGSLTMADVSGTGTYTREVTLENWNPRTEGAVLHLSGRQDEIVSVKINGTETPVFSNITDEVDISSYLKTGKNTVEVKTATTLLNRALAENEAFDGTQHHPGQQAGAQDYGLKSASLTFYGKSALSYEAADAQNTAEEAQKAAEEAQKAAEAAKKELEDLKAKAGVQASELAAAKAKAEAAEKAAQAAMAEAEKLIADSLGTASVAALANTAYNKVRVSWNKVNGADGYEIYRSTSKSGAYKPVSVIKNAGTVKYTDSKLSCGKTYYYKIRAYKDASSGRIYGAYSAAKKIKAAPAQGTISKLTAGKKTATVKLKKQSGVSGYEIYSAAGKKGTYKKAKTVKAGASLNVKITKLKSGKSRYFKARAYKTVGKKKIYGAWSAVKQVKIK